jgi:sulfate transport system ATP-binding protein
MEAEANTLPARYWNARMSIEVANISRVYGSFHALKDVSLSVKQGELIALLGPSGSGKTTLLRIVAGLDWPDVGDVRLNGKSVIEEGPSQRGVGFVFQHYALFKHLSVFENVAFGLRVRPRAVRPPNAEIKERVTRLLKLVQIDWLADRAVSQLSGGQRQRVALARALAIEPQVLMLDEPFGALDAKVRLELRRWMRRLHDEMGMTTLFVTHDQEEAMELADRVVVMGQGKIEQIGTPLEIYRNPVNPFVYEFLGHANKLPCEVTSGKPSIEGISVVPGFRVRNSDGPGVAYIRPHDLEAVPDKDDGVVRVVAPSGPTVKFEVELNHGGRVVEVEMRTARFEALKIQAGTHVGLLAHDFKVFDPAPDGPVK